MVALTSEKKALEETETGAVLPSSGKRCYSCAKVGHFRVQCLRKRSPPGVLEVFRNPTGVMGAALHKASGKHH